ncbi:Uncharacterized protein APZ42_026026 [Daphnia magna]|uniref:Uncharacterized protein n=1 Tax=Daphnia magna TaxID=35525 RepID=A0A164SKN7_9CRUS|nr:Uncharacterized protein APZ42_026026 [Daphnia magna]
MMSVRDLSSLEDVVEENTLVRKDEFDRDGDLVEDGNGVSVGSIDLVVTRNYPIPITSLRDAKDLKHNTVIDLDCIVKDSSNEVIIFSHSEKSKKEVLVYDSSCLPGETFVFDVCNGDVLQFENLNGNYIYRLQVRDAKVTIFREQMYLSLSFSGKIL